MKRILIAMALLLSSTLTFAGTNSYCGKKAGSGTEARLEDENGNERLNLSERGGGTSLLVQANKIIGGSGLKNGESYCLTVMMNGAGSPIKVLKARPDVLAKGKKTVAPPVTSKSKALPDADEKKSQTLKEVPKEPLPATDL